MQIGSLRFKRSPRDSVLMELESAELECHPPRLRVVRHTDLEWFQNGLQNTEPREP